MFQEGDDGGSRLWILVRVELEKIIVQIHLGRIVRDRGFVCRGGLRIFVEIIRIKIREVGVGNDIARIERRDVLPVGRSARIVPRFLAQITELDPRVEILIIRGKRGLHLRELRLHRYLLIRGHTRIGKRERCLKARCDRSFACSDEMDRITRT